MKRIKVNTNEVGARTLNYLRGEREMPARQCKSKQALLTMYLPFPDEPPVGWCPHCGQKFDVTTDACGDHFEILRESSDWREARYRHKACGGVVMMRSWADD
jgi:hypothetical protein